MLREYIIDIIKANKGKFLGAFLGLLFSIFVLIIGFFRTIFIVICIYFGYYIGKKIDNNEDLFDFIKNILNNNWK
ncbi:Small integral membrane protein [Caloramator fervidus]|uniref:Small integral membrane protein n=1 Tax=Caloramator fervidus TaxID=29344 RepID=A0A1H5V648_9CLOT|nr:DUF2273 domain-containing protein [Caloramator fervidus]SEF82211.1 Small integral membrane protein [Caloramator fervidus]